MIFKRADKKYTILIQPFRNIFWTTVPPFLHSVIIRLFNFYFTKSKLSFIFFTWVFFFYLIFYFLNFKIFNSYMRSQTWTPLPPPSPQHLSGSSPCTSPKHAAPCVRHGLAIQFLHDSIPVRIPILPNHPTLSLSLWVQKSIIHICVFFPVLHTGSSLPSS